jgi:hypothetical protein
MHIAVERHPRLEPLEILFFVSTNEPFELEQFQRVIKNIGTKAQPVTPPLTRRIEMRFKPHTIQIVYSSDRYSLKMLGEKLSLRFFERTRTIIDKAIGRFRIGVEALSGSGESFKCKEVGMGEKRGCITILAKDNEEALVRCAFLAGEKGWFGSAVERGRCEGY